jgi:hypothetical protein
MVVGNDTPADACVNVGELGPHFVYERDLAFVQNLRDQGDMAIVKKRRLA